MLGGNGNGTFKTPTMWTAGLNPSVATTADLNGDGKPDLIVGGAGLNVLLSNGTGGYLAAVNVSTQTVGKLTAGDFDNDGKIDLATSNTTVSFFHGNGNGTFNAPVAVPTQATPLRCACGGRLKVHSVVSTARTADEVLKNLGLWQPRALLPPPRGPPQLELL